jgi:glycogen debranching enzyme
MTTAGELPPPLGKGPTRPCLITTLNGSLPHALLYDLTHDNESPLDKRSAEDGLSTGARATFSFAAIGSVKGFDELYPKLLDLVKEKRRYEIVGVEDGSGIGRAKRLLNSLHTEMVLEGYDEGHVHQENDVCLHGSLPAPAKHTLTIFSLPSIS